MPRFEIVPTVGGEHRPIYSCSLSLKASSASNLHNPSRRGSTLSKTALQQRSFTTSLRSHPPFSQTVLEQPPSTRNNEQPKQPVQVSSPFSNPRHGSQSSKVKHTARHETHRQIHTLPQARGRAPVEYLEIRNSRPKSDQAQDPCPTLVDG